MKNLEWSFERFYTPEAREEANICLHCTRHTCEGYCSAFKGPNGKGEEKERRESLKGYFRSLSVTQGEVACVLGVSQVYLSRYMGTRLGEEEKQKIKNAAIEAARRKYGKL